MKEARNIGNELIREFGDICTAYAYVCNRLNLTDDSRVCADVKTYLEQRMAWGRMEDNGWDRTGTGCWTQVGNERLWKRFGKRGAFGEYDV